MINKIQLLPENVANQIAAGEVVLRPSSIVKELIENSVDSGATNISLVVKNAGKTLVRVIDNGSGIAHDELELAFERHATSKIKIVQDLFQIKSNGFRGEALSSIAAISHVTAVTRKKNNKLAKSIKISGNKIQKTEFKVSSFGTVISVRNLFYNVPARRNFLKSDSVELKHIIDEFSRLSLANQNVNFSFYRDNSEIFDLKPTNLRKRILTICGNRLENELVPIQEETPLVKIEGFIVKPSGARKSRGHQFFFVNNRFIKSPFLNHAVKSSFQGLLSDKLHPGYFIRLDIDPSKIDVNIHPTKNEIKFEDEQSIYAILKSTIKHSLGIFQVTPSLDFEMNTEMDIPYSFRNKNPLKPLISVDSSFNPFIEQSKDQVNSNSELNQVELDSENNQQKLSLLETNFNPNQIKVFQLFNKYLVTALPSGLLIINQNRAHQRVLYERFLGLLSNNKSSSQKLLFPHKIKLSKLDLISFRENKAIYEVLGFEFNEIDSEIISILSVPNLFLKDNLDEKLKDLFLNNNEIGFDSFSNGDLVSKRLSKSMAIQNGKILNLEEQQELLASLFACKENQVSPFNLPILINFDRFDLDKQIS
ncbi:MAG: DNA mismatch repair protein MutL [Flavobacteriaceae bacterium]|nr:DNA mismatch repair protein MutL [Flavobacteriaceae bacterium]